VNLLLQVFLWESVLSRPATETFVYYFSDVRKDVILIAAQGMSIPEIN